MIGEATEADVVETALCELAAQVHAANAELVRLLARFDELYAVWDGLPARGYGGTDDVVTAARRLGLPTTIIWPDGAT